MHDALITGGLVVDGTGPDAVQADVTIRDGLIVTVGHDLGESERTIDAGGHLVTSGFVDVHTHFDAQVMWDARMEPVAWHGVTTAVIGNCGDGNPSASICRGSMTSRARSTLPP